MNVYRSSFLTIDYCKTRKRFSFSTTNNEWMSLTVNSFKIFLAMIDNSYDYQNVQIKQSGSEIQIVKLFKNMVIIFTSLSAKRSYSKIQITNDQLQDIKLSGENIIDKITLPSSLKDWDYMDDAPSRQQSTANRYSNLFFKQNRFVCSRPGR